ncbi:hypothetical protein EC973_004165 [Apophysomyces ossiformis]|uniref:Uncharacterized protein n=1 Tax=Apophysomyces ossiformis TaxID=679940 RepID=A0A8H7BLK2_9FUNG|nr:hypothetical protein EC973_004165 [Apophysomyces ossiformis]
MVMTKNNSTNKHISLTNKQREQICAYKLAHPTITHEELATWAMEEFKLHKLPTKSTISRMLKRLEEEAASGSNDDNKKGRITKGKWPATTFAERLGIDSFKGSDGWMHRLHGEAAFLDDTGPEIATEHIKETLKKYEAKDIYNFGLLCNADGSDKWEPLIIGMAKKPERFKANSKRMEASDHGFNYYFLNSSGHYVEYEPTNVELLLKDSYREIIRRDFVAFLGSKAPVLLVDEYNTSKVCSSCDETTEEYRVVTLRCQHKTKVLRLYGDERKRRYRLDADDVVMHHTSVCEERVPVGWCQTAHAEDGPTARTVFWNRDVNAGKNIKRTLVSYMESDHDLGSRPESLQRGTRNEQEPMNHLKYTDIV